MVDIEDLIGIPFKVHGRDRKGLDCYGCLIEFEKKFGRRMKDVNVEYSKDDYEELLNSTAEDFIRSMGLVKTDTPKEGDVVLFFENGKAIHLGGYLMAGDFVHCDKYGVRVSNFETYFRKHKEVYKWQK